MHLRHLPQLTLQWLVETEVLPTWQDRGRFTPFPGSTDLTLNDGQQALLHYATLDGPLYSDRSAWRRAFDIVDSFSTEEVLRKRSVWVPLQPFLSYDTLRPGEVLDALHSSSARVGLKAIDRDDRRATSLFKMEDACFVADLPEPYGNWFQHCERRACWSDNRALEFEVRCVVEGRRTAAQSMTGSGFVAELRVETSTLAPTLISDLYASLTEDRQKSPRAMRSALLPSVLNWLTARR